MFRNKTKTEVVAVMIDMINRRKLLNELKSYDFILTELNLYLDSHPNDKTALQMHCEASKNAEALRKKYTQTYGALTAATSGDSESWQWIKGPWPWENDCEGR